MSSVPARAHSGASARTQELLSLSAELDSLSADIRSVASGRDFLDAVPAEHRASAANLIHYLALRRHDLRALQPRLSALGLSSLGRAEPHVLASLDAVRVALRALNSYEGRQTVEPSVTTNQQELLAAHAQALLGPAPAGRQVRIMVTVPTEAGADYSLVHELVRRGMDCMRINCAHDNPDVWARMIEHLRRASATLGRPCRVAMDLGGPKLRTGPLAPGAAVLKIRPQRDIYGRVTAPARVWLAGPRGQPAPSPADATLPLPAAWLGRLRAGDTLKFTDARAERRVLKVIEVHPDGVWTELAKTSYVIPGTSLRRVSARGKATAAAVGDFPGREKPIVVHTGDMLVIDRSSVSRRMASRRGRKSPMLR